MANMVRSFLYFIVAGICEIGGAYLVWSWLREDKPAWFGVLGAGSLFLYVVIQTQQPANFGRVFAAYGGVFIAMSILWGWLVDKIAPDRFDLIGGLIALVGVFVIMFAPRG